MPINVKNNEARARILYAPGGRGKAVTLMPGITTPVPDDLWKEISKAKVRVRDVPTPLVEMLENEGLIEVEGKAKAPKGEAGVSPITDNPPPASVAATSGAFPGDGGDDITKRYDNKAPELDKKKR